MSSYMELADGRTVKKIQNKCQRKISWTCDCYWGTNMGGKTERVP